MNKYCRYKRKNINGINVHKLEDEDIDECGRKYSILVGKTYVFHSVIYKYAPPIWVVESAQRYKCPEHISIKNKDLVLL